MRSTDLIGQKFGKLTVIAKTNKHDGTCIIWQCQCDCGNIKDVSTRHLKGGNIVSCGCQRVTASKINLQGDPKEKIGIKFDTNISRLKSQKIQRNNTSGVTGVYKHTKTKKWLAYIYFKKKRYHLGLFDKLEDATRIRKEAEQQLFGEFLEWYKNLK
jgi:hypothetical protein